MTRRLPKYKNDPRVHFVGGSPVLRNAMPELQKGLGVSMPGKAVMKFQQLQRWWMHDLEYGTRCRKAAAIIKPVGAIALGGRRGIRRNKTHRAMGGSSTLTNSHRRAVESERAMQRSSKSDQAKSDTRHFIFSTGIENSYPVITDKSGKSLRRDGMELSGHYHHWKKDLRLVKELGIDCLRYGPPYYKTHLGPMKYDWSFADQTFRQIRSLGIWPIVDLCHFGVPDWIGNFQNPEWPLLFADYAAAFAKRFRWVKFYTPVNEIFVCTASPGNWDGGMSGSNRIAPSSRRVKHMARRRF